MRSSEFEARTAYANQLSEVDVLGSFNFETMIIHLKSLRADDIERSRKARADFKPEWSEGKQTWMTGNQYSAMSKVQPLAVHEYTHFLDSTSTLWGLRHLKAMSEAYASNGNSEDSFHRAKKFFDHARSIRLPKYYTVTYKNPHDKMPWESRLTIGRVFDAKGALSSNPIFFSQFYNSEKQIIVRSPVSEVSILEASAMAQEILCHANLVRLTDPDYRLVEEREFTTRTLNFLYSPAITEYSVCVHILANRLQCKDVLLAFTICARLVRIVLNFPESVFDKMADSCPVREVFGGAIEESAEHAIRDGLRAHNLGVIYGLLCLSLPSSVVEGEEQLAAGIDDALIILGLSSEGLVAARDKEATALAASLGTSKIGNIKVLASAGHENLMAIPLQAGVLHFGKLNLPPALLGDDSIDNLFAREGNRLAAFDLEDCFNELDDGMSWVRRFAEACV